MTVASWRAVAPHPPMPVCPRCYTNTETVATQECVVPPCVGPATPAVPCTRTLDLRQTTTTVVANAEVCPFTPTVTEISLCPTATACNEVDCELLTLGEGGWTTDPTRYITNCRPSSTPWTQATPVGWTPDPTKAPPDLPTDEVEAVDPAGDVSLGDEGWQDGAYDEQPWGDSPDGYADEDPSVTDEDQHPITFEPWPTVDILHPPSPGEGTASSQVSSADLSSASPTPSSPAVTPAQSTAAAAVTPRATTATTDSTAAFTCSPRDNQTATTSSRCPVHSCASVSASCGPDWTSPTHATLTLTSIRSCTSTVKILTTPCPMCATCVGHGYLW